MKTCSCTLPYSDAGACDECPYLAQQATNQPFMLPISTEEYSIDFGDDFILLRKRK